MVVFILSNVSHIARKSHLNLPAMLESTYEGSSLLRNPQGLCVLAYPVYILLNCISDIHSSIYSVRDTCAKIVLHLSCVSSYYLQNRIYM